MKKLPDNTGIDALESYFLSLDLPEHFDCPYGSFTRENLNRFINFNLGCARANINGVERAGSSARLLTMRGFLSAAGVGSCELKKSSTKSPGPRGEEKPGDLNLFE